MKHLQDLQSAKETFAARLDVVEFSGVWEVPIIWNASSNIMIVIIVVIFKFRSPCY